MIINSIKTFNLKQFCARLICVIAMAPFFCSFAGTGGQMVAAGGYQINEPQILQLTEEIHLQNPKVKQIYNSITDVKTEIENCNLFTFGREFSPYLNEICNNTIGEIAMKLLIANMKVNGKKLILKFGDDGDWFNGRIVSIDLNNYDPDGTEKDPLCGIGRNGRRIVKKFDTITSTLFHELCHALHRYSGREITECKLLETIYREKTFAMRLWIDVKNNKPDDEEVYNITGFYYDEKTGKKKFDPISCNMFDICANASNPESIIQRVFHWDNSRYNYYLRRFQTLKSTALYRIEEFLIDVNKYIK